MNVCYLSPAVAPTVFRETHLGTQMLKLIVELFKLWQQCSTSSVWCKPVMFTSLVAPAFGFKRPINRPKHGAVKGMKCIHISLGGTEKGEALLFNGNWCSHTRAERSILMDLESKLQQLYGTSDKMWLWSIIDQSFTNFWCRNIFCTGSFSNTLEGTEKGLPDWKDG